MDWRQKLYENFISKQILNEIITIIENEDTLRSEDNINDVQLGGSAQNVTFSWKQISKSNDIISKKLKRKTNKTTFQIDHNFGVFSDLFLIENNVDNLYAEFMSKQLEDVNDNDLVSLSIDHENLNGKPIFISPQHKKNFDKHSFFNAIYEISQSNHSCYKK